MPTVEYKTDCELCGQPVEIEGFSLRVGETDRSFCCAGCKSIYKLIYINNLENNNSPVVGQSQITNKSNEDR